MTPDTPLTRIKNWLKVVGKSHTILPPRPVVEDIAALVEQLETCPNEAWECNKQIKALTLQLERAEKVVDAAKRASDEIQSQKVTWPGEVDTLMDALDEYFADKGKTPY